MRRTTCSACGHHELDEFLDLGSSPVADAYTTRPDESSPRYPLQVAVCAKCRLVQLLEIVDHRVLFGTGYSFYSSASPPLSAYHGAYARDVLHQHQQSAQLGVVEIGCNDGDLLRHFRHLPAVGVDPASGPAATAQARGLDVLVQPFGLHIAYELRDRRGPQGLVIANHVLAHVADVADVLAGVSTLLHPNGVAMVEVQYLPDLLVNNAFDLVYHEHRNFFSLTSLEQAAERHGLYVIDAQLTDRQGGSLRVTLSRRAEHSPNADRIRHSERWLQSWAAYEGMQGRVERIRTRLVGLVADEVAAGRGVAGYGAPAKATTLLNFCGLTRDHIAYVVDTTTAKQHRYIPGTGIRILPPDELREADTYLLFAWNYARQIMGNNPGRRWIVPIPAPVLL